MKEGLNGVGVGLGWEVGKKGIRESGKSGGGRGRGGGGGGGGGGGSGEREGGRSGRSIVSKRGDV